MVVNFTHEEVELPKATILGIGEQVSESQIAAVNDNPSGQAEDRPRDTKVNPDFRKYLDAKLSHLSPSERAVIEPVLVKNQGIFYVEGSNAFRVTDLVEHRIITGVQSTIRPTRRDEVASAEHAEERGNRAQLSLVRTPYSYAKKSPTENRNTGFVWTFGRLIRSKKIDV
jgi:hypothetical protein